jgi:hypothetical protein
VLLHRSRQGSNFLKLPVHVRANIVWIATPPRLVKLDVARTSFQCTSFTTVVLV